MTRYPHTKTWPKIITRIFIGIIIFIALVAILAVAGYLGLVYRPAAYNPKPLSAEKQKQAEIYRDRKIQELYNNVNTMKPFNISFDQQAINDLLVLADDTNILSNAIPELTMYFQRPQIKLDNETIVFMGIIKQQGHQTIASIGIKPQINNQGKLEITLMPIKAGAIPIPQTIIRELLTQLSQKMQPLGPTGPKLKNALLLESHIDRTQTAQAIKQIIETGSFTLDACFPVADSKQARIKKINIEKQKLELYLQPELLYYD